MQTKNVIQSEANIIRITSLQKGNVIKIITKPSYGDPELLYGVVLDLFNDGNNSYIQLLEYKVGYGVIEPQIKLYAGDTDLIIFPAAIEEVEQYFSKAVQRIKDDIDNDEKKLETKKLGLQKAEDFMSGELSKKLTTASFEEIGNNDNAVRQAALEV